MNTRLLSIIKSERERRNAPAVKALHEDKGLESVYDKKGIRKIWIVLRGVKDTFNMVSSLASMKEKPILLPGSNHKYVEVEEELAAAGLEPGMMAKIEDRSLSLSSRISILFILFSNLIPGYHLFKAKNTFKYFEILLLYFVLCKWLKKRHHSCSWIIVGDLTSGLISLSAACKYSGENVVYWQYSFLDFKHLPVEADSAIILNNTGLQLSKRRSDKPYYWRNIGLVKTVDTENIDSGPVGVLLNVLAHEKAWDTIVDIQKVIGLPCIVRFHPSSALAIPDLPKEITVSDKSESLESFAEKISLAVCGNTQAQAKLIMIGVPVVQLSGLDLLEFDFHEYVQRNIVPGIKKPVQFKLSEVIEFYHSEKYKRGLYNLIGPTGKDRKPGLELFVNKLANNEF